MSTRIDVNLVKVDPPKTINHDQLVSELGFPVALHLDPQGRCIAVQVQIVDFDESAAGIQQTVAAHVAQPRQPDPPSEMEALKSRLEAIEAKQALQETKLETLEKK